MNRMKTFLKYFIVFLIVFFVVQYGSASIIKRSKYYYNYYNSNIEASIPEFVKWTPFNIDDNFWLWYMALIVALR